MLYLERSGWVVNFFLSDHLHHQYRQCWSPSIQESICTLCLLLSASTAFYEETPSIQTNGMDRDLPTKASLSKDGYASTFRGFQKDLVCN